MPFPSPGELPAHPELPNPLEGVDSAEAWEQRRGEIFRQFEHYVYGKSPELPKTEDLKIEVVFEKESFEGRGILREVVVRFPPEGTPPIRVLVAIPTLEKPVPAFVGLNFGGNHRASEDPDVTLSDVWIPGRYEGVVENRATEAARGLGADRWPMDLAIERGYAMATIYHGDIDPDFDDFSNGVHPFYYAEGQTKPNADEWGAIGAWAFALRLAASYLIADPAIDPERVCVMGHSRNGKTALWAGAQDERFALVVSNQSGCGGAALSRPRRGETLAVINKNFPHWFNDHFPAFDEREEHLPVDQHMLLALIAPRPVLVCSAEEDLWADPEGEFGSCLAAGPVYELLGAGGFAATEFPEVNQLIKSKIGYHIRPGKHNIGSFEWKLFFDFADHHLRP